MERKKFFWIVAIVVAATASACIVASAQTSSLPSVAEQQTGTPSTGAATPTESISDEDALPQDPSEREARLGKIRYFNGGHYDLTRDEDRFFEHYAPSMLPAIPLKESGVVFVGDVLKVQPYLSEDRTHVYTEITFRVEDLFKSAPTLTRPADGTLVIDRIGGIMWAGCSK